MIMHRIVFSIVLVVSMTMNACLQSSSKHPQPESKSVPAFFIDSKGDTIHALTKTDAEWKAELDPASYYVLREKGTERPFTDKLNPRHTSGIYSCRGCKLPLFSTSTKFESGTGWPSFYTPIDKAYLLEVSDVSMGMKRVEVLCHRCGGHLGHVFDDGPRPTGLRYCMNSVSLDFEAQ